MNGKSSGCVLCENPYTGIITPTKLTDRSRFGNDGAWTNVIAVQLPSGLWVRQYNGTAKVDLGSNVSLENYTAKTVLLWVKPAAYTGDTRWIYDGGYYDNPYGDMITLKNSANEYSLHLRNTDATVASKLDIAYIPDVWIQIGYSWNGATWFSVENGVATENGAAVGTLGCSEHSNVLGARNGVASYTGYDSLLDICNRALSAGEILQRFNQERHFFGV